MPVAIMENKYDMEKLAEITTRNGVRDPKQIT
jgi:hypothetical protein